MHPETVKVVDESAENELGYQIINRADLTDEHVLYGDDAKPARGRGKNKAEA